MFNTQTELLLTEAGFYYRSLLLFAIVLLVSLTVVLIEPADSKQSRDKLRLRDDNSTSLAQRTVQEPRGQQRPPLAYFNNTNASTVGGSSAQSRSLLRTTYCAGTTGITTLS